MTNLTAGRSEANCCVAGVGVGDPSNNQLGSSVGENFACYVPDSIPGLAYSFLFLQLENNHQVVCNIRKSLVKE